MLARRRRHPLPLATLLVALTAGGASAARADDGDRPGPGDPAPAFGTKALRGGERGVTFPDDLRGRASLLVAVDVGEHSSRVLLRTLHDLQRTPTYRALGIVAVQRGPLVGRALRRAQKRIEELDLPFPVVIDSAGAIARDYSLAASTFYGAGDWPTVFVVDRLGRVAGRFAGLAFHPDGRVGLETKLIERLHDVMSKTDGPWDPVLLIGLARRSRNPFLRHARQETIVSCAPLNVSGLVHMLAHAPWNEERAVAAGLLGALGRIEAADQLIEAMKWDDSDEVKSAAGHALADMPTPEVLRALFRLLANPDTGTRGAALEALQRATGRRDLEVHDVRAWDELTRRREGRR